MRDYEMMRTILITCFNEGENLCLKNFVSATSSNFKKKQLVFREEVNRLQNEGLLLHNMKWQIDTHTGGAVKGLTPKGIEFARLLNDTKVWIICQETLNNAGLDISYPLIKKVCEQIVEKIVMSCIPEEYK